MVCTTKKNSIAVNHQTLQVPRERVGSGDETKIDREYMRVVYASYFSNEVHIYICSTRLDAYH